MKRIALSLAVLFSAIMPVGVAHAEPVTQAQRQSLCELIAIIITEDGATEVYVCYHLGEGVY